MTRFRTEVLKSESARWVLIGLLSTGLIGVVLTSAPRADDPPAKAEKEATASEKKESASESSSQPPKASPAPAPSSKTVNFKQTSQEVEVGDRLTPKGVQKGSP